MWDESGRERGIIVVLRNVRCYKHTHGILLPVDISNVACINEPRNSGMFPGSTSFSGPEDFKP